MSLFNVRGQALRKGRVSIDSQIYMVTACTRGRVRLFENLYMGRCLVRALIRSQQSADTLAYVVMPDHFHWLMQLKEGYELSSVVRYVKAGATRGVRWIAEHIDPVWQRGFHDRAIRSEENLVDYARYIVANPLRAGITGSIRQYPLWDAKWV